MSDPSRTALKQALAALDQARTAVVAALATPSDLVPLKRAAHEMGLDLDAARKQAKRGAGLKRDGAWFFSADYVETHRR